MAELELKHIAPISILWYYFAEALLISVVISVIAGVSPASKVAKLDPVESLRHEQIQQLK